MTTENESPNKAAVRQAKKDAPEHSQTIIDAVAETACDFRIAVATAATLIHKEGGGEAISKHDSEIVAFLALQKMQNDAQCRQLAALAVAASQTDAPRNDFKMSLAEYAAYLRGNAEAYKHMEGLRGIVKKASGTTVLVEKGAAADGNDEDITEALAEAIKEDPNFAPAMMRIITNERVVGLIKKESRVKIAAFLNKHVQEKHCSRHESR